MAKGFAVSQEARPLVTVAIPTRNRARMLQGCLDSVLGTAFTSIEVYVSDNASTDDTEKIVTGYDDARLRYSRLEKDIGPWGNLSRCLRLGHAPYVVVLPDDDLMLPGNLEPQVRLLERHPSLGFAHSAFSLIGAQDQVLVPYANWLDGPVEEVESGRDYIARSFRTHTRALLASSVIRRAAIGGNRFEEEDGPRADQGFFLRIALAFDVGYVDRVLAACRVLEGSQTSRLTGARARGDAYTGSFDQLLNDRRVKERFLEQHLGREDLRVLKPRRWARRAMVAVIVRASVEETSNRAARRAAWRMLREATRIDRLVAIHPRSIVLMVASVGGLGGLRLYFRTGVAAQDMWSRLRRGTRALAAPGDAPPLGTASRRGGG
jgi:glycosyltransferase involved in cell wall biosynthesis